MGKKKSAANGPWIQKGRREWKDSPSLAARKRANLAADRVRRSKIVARTAAGRRELDALARGAKLGALDKLPVMVTIKRPKPEPPAVAPPKERMPWRIIAKDSKKRPVAAREIRPPQPIASQYIQRDTPTRAARMVEVEIIMLEPVPRRRRRSSDSPQTIDDVPVYLPIAPPRNRPEYAVATKTPKPRRCSGCGKTGHTIRRCKSPLTTAARQSLLTRTERQQAIEQARG